MPITLPPITRRRFLAGSVAGGTALLLSRFALSEDRQADPNRIALLSDTHINADRSKRDGKVVMYDHLQQAIEEVKALDPAPAAMLVNGDCAHLHGLSDDYHQFVGLIEPIREAGCPIHLAMGNHDNRQNFWQALPADDNRVKEMDERQVLVIQTPRADWVMLDSLDKTNSTPGILGDSQLDWLAKELDGLTRKPVIVMVHHQPTDDPKVMGLMDTSKLLDVLMPRKQVKALLYGHTHVWRVEKRKDLHCINLPAVAYVFNPKEPSGWVDAHLGENGMTLELRCLDKSHPKHGDTHKLMWRA